MKKRIKNFYKILLVSVMMSGGSFLMETSLQAYHSQNAISMYDGVLIAAVDVDPGDWGSRAEYTGYNPLGLKDLLLQSQIQGKDYRIRMFEDWAEESANGNKWIVRTGGANSAGNTGNNYARAIGYYWNGGDCRVATSYQ